MDEKKPSTADILAKIRAQKAAAAGASSAAPSPAPETSSPAPEAVAAPTVEAPVAAAAATTPAAPAVKPGSTKDILAAIRAQGGKGAAKPAATAPAAATASTPTPTEKPIATAKPAATTGPLPSVADMVRAARKSATPGATAAAEPAEKAPVVAPPMPAKPLPAKAAASAKKGGDPVRRGMGGFVTVAACSLVCFMIAWLTESVLFGLLGVVIWLGMLTPFAAAWASIASVAGIATLGTARFMFPNVLVEPPSKFKVGPSSDYPLNTVSNKWKDQFGIWIVHTDQYEGKNLIYALSTVCTHLGCTPNWLDGEQKFKCPCHGSGFYITGVNFEGPAPRPLERVGLRIAEDGLLEVDKSLKFQEEMGQWTDAASYVDVV